MKNFLVLLISLVITSQAISCKDDDDKVSEPSINLTATTVKAAFNAKTAKFSVRTNKISWKLTFDDMSWFSTKSPLEGDATQTITLDLTANTSIEPRETYGRLHYVLKGEQKEDKVLITQEGEKFEIHLTETEITADSEGGVLEVGLASNLPWKVISSPDWAQLIETRRFDTIKIEIGVEPNLEFGYRKGEMLFSQEADTVQNTLTIIQYGRGSIATDSLALVDLYNSTNGASWIKKWDLSTKVADWYGVKCGNTVQGTRVVSLALPENNLNGVMPATISNLAFLKNLVLNNNNISGSLPQNFGQMQDLEYIYLYDNKLSGEIPASISTSGKQLYRLYLHNNMFEGEIPESLGELTILQGLGLSNNNLSGSIPESIGKLTKLIVLTLENNRLSGNIPDSYFQNEYWKTWAPTMNIYPQQEGFGFTNVREEE